MSSESTLNAKDKISDAIMKKVLQLCQDFNQNKNNSFETFFEKIIAFLHCYPLWEIGYNEVNNNIFELREFIGQEEKLHRIHKFYCLFFQ